MNVLPFLFNSKASSTLDQTPFITQVCVHKYFNKICLGYRKEDEDGDELVSENHNPEQKPERSEIPFRMEFYYYPSLILVINLMIWMYYSRTRKPWTSREGPFYTILFVLSLTVSFRILFSIVALSISAFLHGSESSIKSLLLQSSLYVDYCSNFFSLSITFFMSLNRCFCFVAKEWNSRIFEGLHVVIPIVFSILVSISGAVTCIITSEIRRYFIERLGFVDVGPNKGYRVMINRTFFLFAIGSIICYVVLYYHLRQRSRMVLTKTNQSQGEQKVFIQLFITTILYITLHLTYEILTILDWGENSSFQLLFICTLGIFNCLPEMSLPLLLICSNFHIKKKFTTWVSSTKNTKDHAITVTAKPSMTAAHTDN